MDNQILDEQIDTKRVRLKTTAYLIKYWSLILSYVCITLFNLYAYCCYSIPNEWDILDIGVIIGMPLLSYFIYHTHFIMEVEYQDDTLS